MPAVAGVWAEVVSECVLDALVDLQQHGATGRQMGRCLIEHPLYQPGSPLGREEGVVRLGKHLRRPLDTLGQVREIGADQLEVSGQRLEQVSLNFAPFAALFSPEAHLSSLQKLERQALLSLKGHFQLDNLLVFNRKFFPTWQRRFVVYERRRDLPRVGIAALAAEAYLPFQSERK